MGAARGLLAAQEMELDPTRTRWTIAVNVSAKEFHDDAFVCNVLQTLEAVASAPFQGFSMPIVSLSSLRLTNLPFAHGYL